MTGVQGSSPPATAPALGPSAELPATGPLVSVVVNYFNPRGDSRLEHMMLFTLDCLHTATQNRLEIIIADGGGNRTPALAEMCATHGWKYRPSDAPEPFARAYNRGMESATGDYLVWMASDIFVTRGWDAALIRELQRTKAWMAAPFLTEADYPPQVRHWPLRSWTFRPAGITFNLNMLTRHCWRTIGPMDEAFTGNFNDIDYLVRIRLAGGEAIIADAGQILHLARATTSTTSSANWDRDHEHFRAKYPKLSRARKSCPVRLSRSIFSGRFVYRLLQRICDFAPDRLSNLLRRFVYRFEPLFRRI